MWEVGGEDGVFEFWEGGEVDEVDCGDCGRGEGQGVKCEEGGEGGVCEVLC